MKPIGSDKSGLSTMLFATAIAPDLEAERFYFLQSDLSRKPNCRLHANLRQQSHSISRAIPRFRTGDAVEFPCGYAVAAKRQTHPLEPCLCWHHRPQHERKADSEW